MVFLLYKIILLNIFVNNITIYKKYINENMKRNLLENKLVRTCVRSILKEYYTNEIMAERLNAIKSELTSVYQDIITEIKERTYKGDGNVSIHDFTIHQLAKIIDDLDKVIMHLKNKLN